jgi:hypothetical protein
VLILAHVDSPEEKSFTKNEGTPFDVFDVSCGEVLCSEGVGGSREESEKALNGGNTEESRWERGSSRDTLYGGSTEERLWKKSSC